MANRELVKYIQTYHEKGYSVTTLRSFLLTRGYDPSEVEEAIQAAYSPQHHSPKWLLPTIIGAGGIILIGLAFFFFFSFLEEDITLSLSSQPSSQVHTIGTPSPFQISIAGASSSTPIDLSYEIRRDGELVDTFSQRVDASQRNFQYTFTPRTSGTYIIETKIVYESSIHDSSFIVTVPQTTQEPIIPEENQTQPPTENESDIPFYEPPTQPPPTTPQATQEPQPAICGNNICEPGESSTSCPADCSTSISLQGMTRFEVTRYIPERVKQVGAQESAKECNTITDTETKDVCFFEIMKESKQSIFCSYSSTPSKRSNCLVTYAMANRDYSVCIQVEDSFSKSTCESLKRSWEIQQSYAS